MTTYLLTISDTYYPCGGVGDWVGLYDHPDKAKEEIRKRAAAEEFDQYHYATIVAITTYADYTAKYEVVYEEDGK